MARIREYSMQHNCAIANAAEPTRDPIVEALAASQPFGDLADGVVEALRGAADMRAYKEGETIYAAGQFDGAESFVIRQGRIRVSQTDPASGSMLVEDFHEREAFGLAAAIAGIDAQRYAMMSIVAEKDCELIAIDTESLRELVAHRPSLSKSLMRYFAQSLVGGGKPATQEASPERRIYAALIALVERDAIRADWRISKMPKHRDLADSAGADEAAAAAAVARLIQTGVARRDYPGLVIDDMSALNKLAH
jgi:CRP-like cAMP-binding protein